MEALEFYFETIYMIEEQDVDLYSTSPSLELFKQQTVAFFELLRCKVSFEEFRVNSQPYDAYSGVIGYNITVSFQGNNTQVMRLPVVASLFFDLHGASNVKESLYFKIKDDK